MNHLKQNNETYLSHMRFAVTIGLSLMLRAIVFVLHGIFPMIPVPRSLNLWETAGKLVEWNAHAESRKSR